MEQAFKYSLHMIKELDIKTEKEYNKMIHQYLILSSESLKYIAQTRNFNNIIKIAKATN